VQYKFDFNNNAVNDVNKIEAGTFGLYFADNKSENNLYENNNLNEISYQIKINGIDNIGRNNDIYDK